MVVFFDARSEAWRSVHSVRWRLLESYALARQERLASPIGLVADMSRPRATHWLRRLLLASAPASDTDIFAGCVERGALCTALVASLPKLAEQLFACGDEPGLWTALVLSDEEVVLRGSWQELISGSVAARLPARQQRRT
jgi:hypothetical protein